MTFLRLHSGRWTFEPNRNILRSASEDLVITDILGTTKGIEALSDFLKETDAFKKTRRSDPSQTNMQPSSTWEQNRST
ncbi:hypothetical protein BKA83DRAFT_4339106 [Pisolithus microcarpus]|nr:hypothetical protein BKA83DRAFT_4339106 [Pisolithus microcarpus]